MAEVIVGKLEESIYTLNHYYNVLRNLLATLDELDADDQETMGELMHHTQSYGLILIITFIEEYRTQFLPSQKDQEIRNQLRIIQPYWDEINYYDDLRALRNSLLTHPRSKRHNNRNVLLSGDLRRFKIPQNFLEFRFIAECIERIGEAVNLLFPGVNERVRAISEIQKKDIPIRIAKIKDVQEFDNAREELRKKVLANLEAHSNNMQK